MNAAQLLQQIRTNRDLIARNNSHAFEHLQMLKSDYVHLVNEEITISLELNNSLAELYFNSNYEVALNNSLAILKRFSDSKYQTLLTAHMKIAGRCYSSLGEFELAEKYLLSALNGDDLKNIDYAINRADTLHVLAMNHEMIEEGSEKSIAYLNEAINLLTGKNQEVKRANCLMGLGNVYNNAEKVSEALKYYQLAADTYEEHYVLANMASAYSNIGNCYIKLADYDKAETFLQKSLELRIKFASPDDISISYYNLAIVFKERKDFSKAESHLLKSKEILERIGNKPYIAEVNDRLAELEQLRVAHLRQ